MLESESLAILTEDIGFCTRNIQHPECTLELAGRFYEELCQRQRARGIARLLLNADTEGFCQDLFESGRAWRHFLSRCAQEGYSDFYVVSSRSEPFFDALAAGGLELARALAKLSPRACRTGDEYEEDYCYARFFHGLVLEEDAATLDEVLEKFEATLQYDTSARLQVCLALKSRSQEAFDSAFMDLLRERKKELNAQRGPRTPAVQANRSLFVEGLGVLRMAERAGLATRREYESCPALARLPLARPPPPGAFGQED